MQLQTKVFTRSDIQNILNAISYTNKSMAHLPLTEISIYRAGFSTALQAIAIAFNIQLEDNRAKLETSNRYILTEIKGDDND